MKTFVKNLICFISFIRAGHEGWSNPTYYYSYSTQSVTPGFVCQPEHQHGVKNLNMSQPLQNIPARENLRENSHLFSYNNPLTVTSTFIAYPLPKENNPQEYLESNINQSNYYSRGDNLTYSVCPASNPIPQGYFHGQPIFYSNTQNSNPITQNPIEDGSRTPKYKHIKEKHDIDLTLNSKFCLTNFTHSLTKESFLSKSREILIFQIELRKNYDKIKYVDDILNLIISKFENDYKAASLFVIYITFATKGFKNYVSRHKNDCIQNLLSSSAIFFIFSDVSLENTINIWKGFNLEFHNMKTGYEILVSIGFSFSFVDEHKNVDRFVFSYKKYVKHCLKGFFWAEDALHDIINS